MRLYKLIMIIETDYYAMSGHGRKDSQTSRRQSPALRLFRCCVSSTRSLIDKTDNYMNGVNKLSAWRANLC